MHLSTAAGAVTPANEDVDYRELMEEPVGGRNYGRAASPDPETFGRRVALDVESAQERDLISGGGFTIVFPSTNGAGTLGEAGMRSHRGTLRGDEHVDPDALRAAVEDALGFTYDELHSVYSTGGRIADHLRGLRERIDARLLALSRRGANMDEFARVTGVTPRTLDRALARARSVA